MPPLVAVVLSGPAGAHAIDRAWDAGEAVLPLSPGAPTGELQAALEALRPTHLVDGDGRRALAGGVPVEESVAAVVATSGTTGPPRGVELTRDALRSSARSVSAALGVMDGDRWLCCLPLHAIAGLAILSRSRESGIPVTVHAGFDPWAVAAERGVTLVSLVPTALARLLGAGAGLSRFRTILVGGSAVPPALRRRAEAAGGRVCATYGLTETCGGVVHDGHPLEGVGLRIGERDEILVRGPTVMRGYRLLPHDTRHAFTSDGWLRTGDAGTIEDGVLRVTDRLRDLIITGGVNVSPTEVERVLARHPSVADVVVVGAPDPHWGERVVAHVVPRDPARPPALGDVQEFARGELSAPKLPRELRIVEEVPRTAGGKPLRRLLRADPLRS